MLQLGYRGWFPPFLSPSLPSALSVTLAGRWELAEPSAHCRIATSDASATTLEFTCREGATREVKLLEKR